MELGDLVLTPDRRFGVIAFMNQEQAWVWLPTDDPRGPLQQGYALDQITPITRSQVPESEQSMLYVFAEEVLEKLIESLMDIDIKLELIKQIFHRDGTRSL